MADLTWTPDEGLLISYGTDGVGFQETVTVEETEIDPVTEEPLPDPDDFTVDNLHSSITFSTSGNTWTISATAEEAVSLFPIEITYLQTPYEDSLNMVSTWDDLPVDASEIIKLETTASSPVTIIFQVTAYRDLEPLETKEYSIDVIHVYDTNADRLKLEIALRS